MGNDLIQQALARLTGLYSEKSMAQQVVAIFAQAFQQAVDVCNKMVAWMDIDTAEGDMLYKIASRVGAPVVYNDQIVSQFIGWDDQDGGFPMADTTQPLLQAGWWREEGQTEITIDDVWAAQRLVIKAKILKNFSRGFTPQIQAALSILFGDTFSYVQNNKDMSFSIEIGRALTAIEIQLIQQFDILPRPAGVQIKNVVYFDPTHKVLALEHQQNLPNAGPLNDPNTFIAQMIEV